MVQQGCSLCCLQLGGSKISGDLMSPGVIVKNEHAAILLQDLPKNMSHQ